jgi:hypothetical protein
MGCLWIPGCYSWYQRLDSWQFEDKFETLAHIGRVWVQVSLIYISDFEVVGGLRPPKVLKNII